MRRLLSLAVLLCVACGDKNPPANTGGFIVHSDSWTQSDSPAGVKAITVLLGDGSRFRQPLGRDGIARFTDASIQGPQDVTLVLAGDDEVVVNTALAVEGPEAWIRTGSVTVEESTLPRQATLTGRVTKLVGQATQVRVVGSGFVGSTTAGEDGSFRIDVFGAAPGKVALYAQESLDGGPMGLLRDIEVGEGRTVSDLEIALDHSLSRRLPVEVTNTQAYGGEVKVLGQHTLDSIYLLDSEGAGDGRAFELPVFEQTPPFDTVAVLLTASAGSDESMTGRVLMQNTASAGVLTSLNLPEPMRLTSPQPGGYAQPGTWGRSRLALGWTADPSALSVTVSLQLDPNAGQPRLTWNVVAPGNVSGFTPFSLPAEVSPFRELPSGHYEVRWESRYLGMGKRYGELYQETFIKAGPDLWFTAANGHVVLQD